MTPIVLAAAWLTLGILAAVALRPLRLTRAAALVPAVVGVAALVAAVHAGDWSGPLRPEGADIMSLGRLPLGVIGVTALSMAVTRLGAPTAGNHDILAASVAGAVMVMALSAGDLLVWATALVVATAVVTFRWATVAPGRVTLAAPRVAGLGAICALAALPFLPLAGQPDAAWPTLVGWLLAAAFCTLLGLVPLGGWAVGSLRSVPAPDGALWLTLMAPAVLLTATALPAQLPPALRGSVLSALLVFGLVSALWNALWACLSRGRDRYPRLAMADLGLASAAIGTGAPTAVGAVLLIIVGQALATPLLLDASRPRRLRARAAWLAVSGLPPSVMFWGRLLAVEAFAVSGRGALVAGVVAMLALSVAAVRALGERDTPALGATGAPHRLTDLLVGLTAVVAVAIGFVPSFAAHALFGQL